MFRERERTRYIALISTVTRIYTAGCFVHGVYNSPASHRNGQRIHTPRLRIAMLNDAPMPAVAAVADAAAVDLAAAAADVAEDVPSPVDPTAQALLLLGGLPNESLQRKRQLEDTIKEAKRQRDKAQRDLRNERRREERLMDKAKGLSVANLAKVLATRVAADAKAKAKAKAKANAKARSG